MADARDDKRATALERLLRSRAALRGLNQASEGSSGQISGTPPSFRGQASLSSWATLAALPGLAHVVDLAKAMWARSPLRLPAQLAGMQWQGVVVPVIRQHPLASLMVAATAGYALTRHRRAVLGLATGALWPALLPPAQALLQSLLGGLTDPGRKAQSSEEQVR